MMNCTEFSENIIPYIDKELSSDLAQVFEQHLKECAECAVLYKSVEATYNYIAIERQLSVSPAFYDKLNAKLDIESGARVISLFPRIIKPIAVAASIGFGIMLGNFDIIATSDTVDQVTEELSSSLDLVSPVDYSVWISMNDNYGSQN